MSGYRNTIEQVRKGTDLVALIHETVPLSRVGSVFKGRSPWNRDTSPSLVVWPDTQTWRDFSGGGSHGGDCFDWLQRRDTISFPEALRRLDSREGNPPLRSIEAEAVSDDAVQAAVEKRRLETILTAAAAYYHGVLSSAVRRSWYHERYGFTDATVDELLLGCADGKLYGHLRRVVGVTEEEALSTGLFVRFRGGRIVELFQGRLVFPYWRGGRVVYFIARATERTPQAPWEKAKYKKLLTASARHPYVSPHLHNDTFYNEDALRGAKELLIAEGVTDCISACQHGFACISPATVRFRSQDRPKLVAMTSGCTRIVICNDAEEHGAGDAGAIETAQLLIAHGREVRIARLPRSPTDAKVDLNAFLTAQGRKAFEGVIENAKPLSDVLLEHIPTGTPKAELGVFVAPILESLKRDPCGREAFMDGLRERFSLRPETLKALCLPVEATSDQDAPRITHRGEVFEGETHYYVHGRQGQPVAISSFKLEPLRRITTDAGDLVEADVVTDHGTRYRGMRFPREAWHSRRQFVRALGPLDLQWTGSDDHVQGVLRCVAKSEAPSLRGTTQLGYLETSEGARWVSPDGVLGPSRDAVSQDWVFVPDGSSLATRCTYRASRAPEEPSALAKAVFSRVVNLNAPEVILPVLGWFFAAPLKPRFQRALGHFPILCLWGTQGSGKCVAGDTWICTERGFMRMAEFDRADDREGLHRIPKEQRVRVWNGSCWAEPSHFFRGRAKTYRLRTSLGYEVTGTSEHPVMTARGWVPLGELELDRDRLWVGPLAWPVALEGVANEEPCTGVPTSVRRGSWPVVRDFLRDVLRTRGRISGDQILCPVASPAFAYELHVLLLACGVVAQRSAAQEEAPETIVISTPSALDALSKGLGVVSHEGRVHLREPSSSPPSSASPFFDRVSARDDAGEQRVYDMTLPEGHRFMTGGLLSHNSSLIKDVFWPLVGVTSSEPYSATETEFALIRLLSSTHSVPVFIDEYKPLDMARHRVHTLHRFMRRLYNEETEERGRSDLSIKSYRLSAPLCLAGETRPIEAALMERIVPVNTDKHVLRSHPRFAEAYRSLRSYRLPSLAPILISELLARNTEADLERARQTLAPLLKQHELPFRVRDNLLVVTAGLHAFAGIARRFSMPWSIPDMQTVWGPLLADLLEGEGACVKSGLDYFLEELSVLAVTGDISYGRHYTYHSRGLALHFASCHAAYREHARRSGMEGEILDRKAMRRHVHESHRGGGYVLETNLRVCFNGRSDRRRAIIVDLDRIRESLDVDFPSPGTLPTSKCRHDRAERTNFD